MPTHPHFFKSQFSYIDGQQDRVYISTGFKKPTETPLSKPNFFRTLLFTVLGEQYTHRVQFGKSSRWKLVFIITQRAFTRAAKKSRKKYVPVELRWRRCCWFFQALFQWTEICQRPGDSGGTFNERLLLIAGQTAVNYRRAGVSLTLSCCRLIPNEKWRAFDWVLRPWRFRCSVNEATVAVSPAGSRSELQELATGCPGCWIEIWIELTGRGSCWIVIQGSSTL